MHQGNHRDHEGAKKLFALIKDIKVAMMTTADPDGKLYSRPMWCQDADENGDLWFFSKLHSPKTAEISKDNQINLAYSDPSSQTYVSIAGKAEIVTSSARASVPLVTVQSGPLGRPIRRFRPFAPGVGVTTEVRDVTGDRLPDILAASSRGFVTVIDGQTLLADPVVDAYYQLGPGAEVVGRRALRQIRPLVHAGVGQ